MADNLDIINCPACHNAMTKVHFPDLGINIDVCTEGCGGIYFDNRELEKFDEAQEDITPILESIKGKKFEEVDASEPRMCPVCGTKMVRHYNDIRKEVMIDECYNCGGVFLDNKELFKIREAFKKVEKEGSQEAVDEFNKMLVSTFKVPENAVINFIKKFPKSSTMQLFEALCTNMYKNM